jgi:hypothetical protein
LIVLAEELEYKHMIVKDFDSNSFSWESGKNQIPTEGVNFLTDSWSKTEFFSFYFSILCVLDFA